MIKNHVHLAPGEREVLQQLVAGQNVPVKVHRRAVGLLALDEGSSLRAAAQRAQVSVQSVSTWRDLYKENGLTLLQDAPRSGCPPTFSGEQRAQLTALACSTPPEGHGRWTMTLLADKAVELGFVESISRARVAVILKKTN